MSYTLRGALGISYNPLSSAFEVIAIGTKPIGKPLEHII